MLIKIRNFDRILTHVISRKGKAVPTSLLRYFILLGVTVNNCLKYTKLFSRLEMVGYA